MKITELACWGLAVGLCAGCVGAPPGKTTVTQTRPTFGDDLAFLDRHVETVVLSDASGDAQVVVVPEFQGRVMTSTSGGEDGISHGWINRTMISRGARRPHMNPFGGEDRFWLGPEGGQYSLYFEKGAPFDFEHWQVPEPIDWSAWPVVKRTDTEVAFRKEMWITNYFGTQYQLAVDRTVKILDGPDIDRHLNVAIEGQTQAVAYESINTITNTGKAAWERSTGLLSIWILGMYVPSPATTVVIPFKPGDQATLGPIVNDAYFGKVPDDRLVVTEKTVFFRGDGKYRSKVGIPRPRALPVIGSHDASNRVLTIVQYTLPQDAVDYVNSMWEIQDEPYAGDVANSYNDGPPKPGKRPMGPFYELESSSPAAALKPNAQLTHVHRTIHLQGPDAQLDAVARANLGVGLNEIKAAFGN